MAWLITLFLGGAVLAAGLYGMVKVWGRLSTVGAELAAAEAALMGARASAESWKTLYMDSTENWQRAREESANALRALDRHHAELLRAANSQTMELAQRLAQIKVENPSFSEPDTVVVQQPPESPLAPEITEFITLIDHPDAREEAERIAYEWRRAGKSDEQVLDHIQRGESPPWEH